MKNIYKTENNIRKQHNLNLRVFLLMLSLPFYFSNIQAEEITKKARILSSKKNNISKEQKQYIKEYFSAVKEGDLLRIKDLIDHKKVNLGVVQRKNRNTALHLAASEGHLKVVEYLIEAGLDISTKNALGDTILFNAAYSGNLELLQYLIDKGLSAFIPNKKGYNLLHYAAYGGDMEAVKYLIKLGLNPKSKGKAGETPLMAAIYKRNFRVASFLSMASKR